MTENTQSQPVIDDAATAAEVVREKLIDALTPGFVVEFDPREADTAGAFAEDALSEGDALASTEDLPGDDLANGS
jgi:hypothetical protein